MQPSNNIIGNSAVHSEYESLLLQYVAICNRALTVNKDKFPFREIWALRRSQFGTTNTLHCVLFDDRPKLFYELSLRPSIKIALTSPSETFKPNAWPFRISYLQEVCAHPDAYMEHPLRLDWRWIGEVNG